MTPEQRKRLESQHKIIRFIEYMIIVIPATLLVYFAMTI